MSGVRFEYPLAWPPGMARTDAGQRHPAKFSRRGTKTLRRADGTVHQYTTTGQVTLANATKRVSEELARFTRAGRAWRIDPDEVVITTNLQVRLDGRPRANQRAPDDPGVCVYFDLDREPYGMPCDKWTRLEDNLAAVAAHLGAMRGMERWGVGSTRQHMGGFRLSLPNPDKPKSWRDVLGIREDQPVTLADVDPVYRNLAHLRHPDRGGDAGDMAELNAARDQARKELS